jgi:general stress protein YciG
MPGTKEGAKKAAATNKANDPNFYSTIGKKSWNNPERSHETGFAKLPREKVAELGRRGGKKTKNDYKTTQRTEGPQVTGQFKIEQEEWTTAEDIQALYSPEDLDGPSISE